MRRIIRILVVIACAAVVGAAWPSAALAQRGKRSAPAVQRHRPTVRGHVVFVGGYFYDPFFGPFPWWERGRYPYRYFPSYDDTAIVRIVATPKDAAVYADGFYAGTVHDFNDWFQGLSLPPGGHEIVLFLDGYRTIKERIYLRPASSIKLQHTLAPLPAGEKSELPVIAPAVPPPPVGTYMPPYTPQCPLPAGSPVPLGREAATGTLSLQVQPPDAEVIINRDRWTSSDGIHFVIDLSVGAHRLTISRPGYQSYVTEIQLRAGQTLTLNVTLKPETP